MKSSSWQRKNQRRRKQNRARSPKQTMRGSRLQQKAVASHGTETIPRVPREDGQTGTPLPARALGVVETTRCPSCESTNVETERTSPWRDQSIMRCQNCGLVKKYWYFKRFEVVYV